MWEDFRAIFFTWRLPKDHVSRITVIIMRVVILSFLLLAVTLAAIVRS